MELSSFDYELPAAAVAQAPAATRDESRLLLIDRGTGRLADHHFTDLVDLLRPGDCVVLNNSRVIPARVLARAATDRIVELLFLEPVDERRWRALVRPGRRGRVGARLRVGGEPGLGLVVVGVDEEGARVIEPEAGTIFELLDLHGLPPLPPYIARHAKPTAEDWDRYQTVYARPPGSVAAPTAGLHFTPALLDALRRRGMEVWELTLHVGPATFRPIRTRHVEDHVLPPERVTIAGEVAEAVNRARAAGRRVVAVGTTTTRALESVADAEGRVRAHEGAVGLYVTPGYRFRVVDALLTNFHLPRSSLLVLVAAFAGRELVLRAYRHALAAGYRFYSYGDATLIV
ncbi:MAG: tRNA preQ1(34) S-adenosylmethionine ribosyltransferase-isomerase QueA [Candidatus Rokuibacteriota bacterium]